GRARRTLQRRRMAVMAAPAGDQQQARQQDWPYPRKARKRSCVHGGLSLRLDRSIAAIHGGPMARIGHARFLNEATADPASRPVASAPGRGSVSLNSSWYSDAKKRVVSWPLDAAALAKARLPAGSTSASLSATSSRVG